MGAKESAVAKSTGQQDSDDTTIADMALYKVLETGKKVTKLDSEYRIQQGDNSCTKCKFNLGDESRCHIVAGDIDNEHGISRFFSPKGEGMLPGDIVWKYAKSTEKKLSGEAAYVISEGAPGFQCKNCKFYLPSNECRIVKGILMPEMSCGFIVKVGSGMII